MLSEIIDRLIMDSMKSHDEVRTNALRSIKAEFINARTAKGAGEFNSTREIQVLQKMVKQRLDSIDQYKQGHREDLAEREQAEIEIINEFLPKPVSEEELDAFISECFNNVEGDLKKQMGNIIKAVKEKYPTADGRVVADKVKSYIEAR